MAKWCEAYDNLKWVKQIVHSLSIRKLILKKQIAQQPLCTKEKKKQKRTVDLCCWFTFLSWTDPQGHLEGGGPLGLPNFAPQRRIPGFGGSQPAIITNTTVEVVVPSSLVPVINGEDGECLKQIRQVHSWCYDIDIKEPWRITYIK